MSSVGDLRSTTPHPSVCNITCVCVYLSSAMSNEVVSLYLRLLGRDVRLCRSPSSICWRRRPAETAASHHCGWWRWLNLNRRWLASRGTWSSCRSWCERGVRRRGCAIGPAAVPGRDATVDFKPRSHHITHYSQSKYQASDVWPRSGVPTRFRLWRGV